MDHEVIEARYVRDEVVRLRFRDRERPVRYDSMRISSTSNTSMPFGAPGWPR